MFFYLKKIIKDLYFYAGHKIFSGSYRVGYFSAYEEAFLKAKKTSYYENVGYHMMYQGNASRIEDYPIFFHLTKKFKSQGLTVFDYGGAQGAHHLLLKQYLEDYEHKLTKYMVCEDAPTVDFCLNNSQEKKLYFTTDLLDCENFDILLSVGTLQVTHDLFYDNFSRVKNKPESVLLGHVEITTSSRDFYTVANNGNVHKVVNEATLIDYFEHHGYVLEDSWHESSLVGAINWKSEIEILHKGFYFECIK